jgi:hypothetical protein
VVPLLQTNVKGFAPPLMFVETDPFALPHVVGTTEPIVTTGPLLLLTLTFAETVQPFASVTVREYVAATNPFAVVPVAPFDQVILKGDVPPLIVTEADPFAFPQDAFVDDVVIVGPGISFTCAEIFAVQLFASVMVNVYVPAETFAKSCAEDPLLHKYCIGNVPPFTLTSTNPFALPQVVLVMFATDGTGPGLSAIETV